MNTLPRLLPSLPFCYQDGSFQVILRNAESVAVFWDLPEDPSLAKSDARLCLRVEAIDRAGESRVKSPEVLILHHEAGHAFVPLAPLTAGCETYRFTLGWDDGDGFQAIAVDEVEMPMVEAVASEPGMTQLSQLREGCGFHPLAMAVAR